MYRASPLSHGLWSVIAQELGKVPASVLFTLRQQREKTALALTRGVQFLQGHDQQESAEMQSRRQQHKEMYSAIMQAQARRAAEQRAKELASRTWLQRMRFHMASLAKELKASLSTSAGVMALVQQCTAAHAAEVAMEQGIKVEDVTMSVEVRPHPSAVGETEEVVVGYIDAPAATEEEVYVFAERLQQACPMARQMHIEWRSRQHAPRGSERDTEREAADRPMEMPTYEPSRRKSAEGEAYGQYKSYDPSPQYTQYGERAMRRGSSSAWKEGRQYDVNAKHEEGAQAERGVSRPHDERKHGADECAPTARHGTETNTIEKRGK